jgi:putative endonuclease
MDAPPPRPRSSDGPAGSSDLRRRRGRLAECLAAWWLRARGWSVPARNLRVAGVQVDLLARRGRVEALVEVKARRLRRGEAVPSGVELLSQAQGRRLLRAAEARAADLRSDRVVRVDLVVVLFSSGRLPRFRHLEGLEPRSDVQ